VSGEPSTKREPDLLDQVIAEYLRAAETGQAPDQAALLARYPELAAGLTAFFADRERFLQAAQPLAPPAKPVVSPLAPWGPDHHCEFGVPCAEGQTQHAQHGSGTPPPASFGDTVAPAGATTPHPEALAPSVPGYEILGELGRGGMGVVYKARQVSLDRVVALKMILAGQLATEEDVQRFQTEARTAASLQHPNIVAVHEVGQHDRLHYFSMDYVEGSSLADLIRESPLPPARAAHYVRLTAAAIHHAHLHGTLHRDLKPANVLIDAADQPRVTDFGLARRIQPDGGLTAPGAVLGTPSYMPPEQASGKADQMSPASDVYSLGAVLYELVTGRPPFRAAAVLDTLLQVMEVEPAPPRLLNPDVSRDLETILLKCLAKNPARRYPTAQALAEDLAAFLEDRPIQARRPGLVDRGVRWVRKQRKSVVVASLAALMAVALMGGGILGWGLYQKAQLGRVRLHSSDPGSGWRQRSWTIRMVWWCRPSPCRPGSRWRYPRGNTGCASRRPAPSARLIGSWSSAARNTTSGWSRPAGNFGPRSPRNRQAIWTSLT
jgi:serine/threonine protein kinase